MVFCEGMHNSESIVQVGGGGSGMTMASLHWLLNELRSCPEKRTVYVNFELPTSQRELLEQYAVIKQVGDMAQNASFEK